MDQIIFRGSRFMEEVVFFHRSSSTLILTDLIENFEWAKLPWYYCFLVNLAGTADPDGKVPLDLRLTFWGNKQQARESLERILTWQQKKSF